MILKLFYQLSTIQLISLCSGFTFPTSDSPDLALYANVSVTTTCSNGGTYSCNTTCPTRDDFPTLKDTKQIPLKAIVTPCIKITDTLSNNADAANGGVSFTSLTNNCTEVVSTYLAGSPDYYSLTLWVKASCGSACNIFSIGTNLNMTISGGILNLNAVSTQMQTGNWQFVALRYNGKHSLFVNGQWIDIAKLVLPSSDSYDLKLGPATNVLGSNVISLLDVRWYKDVLTDREIIQLYNNTFLDTGSRSDCRCPATHPKLVREDHIPSIKCTDGTNEVLRLGTDAHILEYMLDRNSSTYWASEKQTESNITLAQIKEFQLKSITLKGIKHLPTKLNLVLFRNEIEMRILTLSINGETATYDFEAKGIPKRSDYESIVADKVVIQAKFPSNNYFTVAELTMEGRCSCYGNDVNCEISKGDYTCSCASSSHTTNTYCNDCDQEYYRAGEDLTCVKSCGCDPITSVNTTCAQVDGQCHCKTNAEGRQCDKCKHNTANPTSTGCRNCTCNPDGIARCNNDFSCTCKANVKNTTGNCEECSPNYFGITKTSGCTACDCDSLGTEESEQECSITTGECNCKTNVQGYRCDQCKDLYFGLTEENNNCTLCNCNIVGSKTLVCNKTTGSCPCVDDQDHAEDGNRQCEPMNLHLEPTYGPLAGGTILTLSGTLLGNSKVTLLLGNTKQTVESSSQKHILFGTQSSSKLDDVAITLYWSRDGVNYHAKDIEMDTRFTYKPNPQILIPSETFRAYISGGCTNNFEGKDFGSVAHPKLMIYRTENNKSEAECFEDAEMLRCYTPALKSEDINKTFSYGFKLDGLDDYKNVSERQNTKFFIVEDPLLYSGFTKPFRNTFDKVVTVKGERLNEACHDSDVTITLGDKNCPILSRTQDTITCDPREEFPGTARTVMVKVKIGFLEKELGELTINSFWTNMEFIYMAVGAGLLVILIILLIVCIVRCRKRSSYNKYKESTPENVSLDEPTSLGVRRKIRFEVSSNPARTRQNNYETNPVAIITPIEKMKKTERTSEMISGEFCDRLKKHIGKIVSTSLVGRSSIDVDKVCTHKGKKVRVLRGQYNASSSSPYSGNGITIKTLVEPYPEEGELPDWINNGLQECTRLQDFIHDNILRMKGISIDAKNLYILYQEMTNRTLKDYISRDAQLTSGEKLDICVQVVSGMEYLSSMGVVHKDLAARNCWVSRELEVKISDASFSYDLYPEEYQESNGRYQPVRWMAPESLRQGYYDTKSDVWSYGVLVWEVYTNGYLPYYDINNDEDVRSKVCDHQFRLGKPYSDCSDEVFQIIEDCHKECANKRPDFSYIQKSLDNILSPSTEDDHLYENRAFTTTSEDDLEDYVNTQFVQKPPPRPPKGRHT